MMVMICIFFPFLFLPPFFIIIIINPLLLFYLDRATLVVSPIISEDYPDSSPSYSDFFDPDGSDDEVQVIDFIDNDVQVLSEIELLTVPSSPDRERSIRSRGRNTRSRPYVAAEVITIDTPDVENSVSSGLDAISEVETLYNFNYMVPNIISNPLVGPELEVIDIDAPDGENIGASSGTATIGVTPMPAVDLEPDIGSTIPNAVAGLSSKPMPGGSNGHLWIRKGNHWLVSKGWFGTSRVILICSNCTIPFSWSFWNQ